VLRRVGLVLIAVGVIDIAYMLYCITRGTSYSSSLNLFALIVGVFLYRGSLTAARIGAHAAAFLLGATLAVLAAAPFMVPPRLFLLALKTAPPSRLLGTALLLVLPVLSVWVYRRLTSEPVTSALDRPVSATRSLVAGALLVLVGAVAVSSFLRGGASDQVLAEARRRVGPDYDYFITQMTTTASADGGSVTAQVLAYDAERIEPIQVRCAGAGASLRCVSRWRGKTEAAPDSADVVAKASPVPQPPNQLALAHESFKKGEFQAAIAGYGAVVDRDPSNTEARYWRGVSFTRIGDRDQALKDFDECISRGDANIEVYVMADQLRARSQEWSRIVDDWTAFIGRNPESGRAYYERGGALLHSGDTEKALKDAEESCRLGYQPGCQVLERRGHH
jgi:hypothetical protein